MAPAETFRASWENRDHSPGQAAPYRPRRGNTTSTYSFLPKESRRGSRGLGSPLSDSPSAREVLRATFIGQCWPRRVGIAGLNAQKPSQAVRSTFPQTQVRGWYLLIRSLAFDLTPLNLFPSQLNGNVIPLNFSSLTGKMGIFIPQSFACLTDKTA